MMVVVLLGGLYDSPQPRIFDSTRILMTMDI